MEETTSISARLIGVSDPPYSRVDRVHEKVQRRREWLNEHYGAETKPRPRSWTRARITIRLDDETADLFKAYCLLHNRSAQEVVEEWVKTTVERAAQGLGLS